MRNRLGESEAPRSLEEGKAAHFCYLTDLKPVPTGHLDHSQRGKDFRNNFQYLEGKGKNESTGKPSFEFRAAV